uniref:Uncharacterized protein n=1 Tax=Clastoptera arizonana TaxID=38151 RepID=A0A1B6CP00_9HEMI
MDSSVVLLLCCLVTLSCQCNVVRRMIAKLMKHPAKRYERYNACLESRLMVNTNPHNLAVNDKNCNVQLRAVDWEIEPTVRWPLAKADEVYTLMMGNPNEYYEEGEYYVHWLLVNIWGSDLIEGKVNRGVTVLDYQGPSEPTGGNVQLYQVLVYRQQSEIFYFDKVYEYERKWFRLDLWFKLQPWTQFFGPEAGIQFTIDYDIVNC